MAYVYVQASLSCMQPWWSMYVMHVAHACVTSHSPLRSAVKPFVCTFGLTAFGATV